MGGYELIMGEANSGSDLAPDFGSRSSACAILLYFAPENAMSAAGGPDPMAIISFWL